MAQTFANTCQVQVASSQSSFLYPCTPYTFEQQKRQYLPLHYTSCTFYVFPHQIQTPFHCTDLLKWQLLAKPMVWPIFSIKLDHLLLCPPCQTCRKCQQSPKTEPLLTYLLLHIYHRSFSFQDLKALHMLPSFLWTNRDKGQIFITISASPPLSGWAFKAIFLKDFLI